MTHITQFRSMWHLTPSEGVRISSETLTEPDQICPSMREILTRFGVLPTYQPSFSENSEKDERDALAASAFAVLSKEEALERGAELAERIEQERSSQAKQSAESEEGPIPSPPQDSGVIAGGLASTAGASRPAEES